MLLRDGGRPPVTIARFVAAFYTTPLFRLERRILASALARPSTDTEAEQLAQRCYLWSTRKPAHR